MPFSFVQKVNAWLTRIVSYPGDDKETLVIKKIWLLSVAGITFVSTAGSFQWLFQLGWKNMFIFQSVYFTYFTLLIILFLRIRRGIEWFVFATAVFHILFSFVIVCIQGGIIASAGLVFVGWGGGPVYFLLLQKYRKWAIHVQVFFMLTVVVEALLQPYLTPDPNVSPEEAVYMFSGFFLIISFAVFLQLRYSINQTAEIKEAEKKRMQELAEMKTRFYTNITHEFRTPLTVILGMADQIGAKPGVHFRSGLQLIRQNGHRLLQLVNQMLDLSKLEAGAMPLQPVQGDIVPYLMYVVEPFQRLAEEKSSRVHFTCDRDSLEMDFDPEKIESLLGNLLSNAVKFSPENSDIHVRVFAPDSQDSKTYRQDGGWYSPAEKELSGRLIGLVVRDNGRGIPADKLPHIFDRFSRVDQDVYHDQVMRPEGTGIGLAVVKELVKLMEGALFVKSSPGEGTEFHVYLPLTNDAPLAPAAVAEPFDMQEEEIPTENHEGKENHASSLRHELPHVLVVEDNAGVVQYLRAILEEDYQIGVAADGQEGIDMALETVPDLIITDVMMPRKDGFELCSVLKSDFRTSHIPIIMLTAKADMESTIAGLERGADAYMTKPFNSRELRTRIRKLIELRDHLREKYRSMSLPFAKIAHPVNPDEEFFDKLTKALEANMGDENFHSGDLCQSLGVSRVQLFRKLKALTGFSASHLVRSFRLNKAKELLAGTDLNVSEIAFEVGFKDPANFTHAFTREFGVAPSAVRRKK
jgi:signal transduction histidine kinase/CheY-like chemotaxis protein